jgi:hypothetical protein
VRNHKFLLAGALLALAACTDIVGPVSLRSPEHAVATLGLSGGATVDTLDVGQSVQLTAKLKSPGKKVRATTWSSSDARVVTVNQSGLATAVGVGSAVVTASNGASTESATLVVVSTAVPTPTPTPTPTPAPSPITGVELPRTYVNTAPAAASGVTWTVRAGDNLQQVINAAAPGDVIALQSGATFTGNFLLPAKSGDAWVTITAAAGTSLPAVGSRITPAYAAGLPKLVTPNNASALATQPGAHHYRIVGIEVTAASSVSIVTALVSLGTDGPGGQKTLASVPHDIVLDRMYIHGSATLDLRRCVALNSANTGIVDSYLADCHSRTIDSQAILGWNGPGPFKIVNNYLEAAGENIMFGGSDPGIPDMVPSDIEIRHNHFYKPLAWRGVWLIKNLFELKNARRVLVEGNVLENSWAAAQDGTAILLKSVNQENTAPWSGTTHVTLRLNVIRNVGAAFNIAAHPEAYAVEPAHSIAVTDNVIQNINTGDFKGSAKAFLLQNALTDITIAHNTVYNDQVPYASLVFGPEGAQMARVTYANNLTATPENWGIYGDNTGAGTVALTLYAPGAVVAGNVFAGNAGLNYPAGNYFTALPTGVGFLSAATGDFSLTAASPYKGLATDGRDPGADVAAVRAATAGVVVP